MTTQDNPGQLEEGDELVTELYGTYRVTRALCNNQLVIAPTGEQPQTQRNPTPHTKPTKQRNRAWTRTR